jgi:hypothetical protein
VEVAVFFPELVPPLLRGGVAVLFGELIGGGYRSGHGHPWSSGLAAFAGIQAAGTGRFSRQMSKRKSQKAKVEAMVR